MKRETETLKLAFRWRYIVLPLAIIAVSAITALISYSTLPDPVAYHFRLDGSPDHWLSRDAVIFWMLAPQLVFTIMAAAIPLAVIGLLSVRPVHNPSLRLDRFIALMGNMMALPQALLCFAMLDIVSYNSYGTHLMPLWIFILVLITAGIVVLGWFFRSAIRQKNPVSHTNR